MSFNNLGKTRCQVRLHFKKKDLDIFYRFICFILTNVFKRSKKNT